MISIDRQNLGLLMEAGYIYLGMGCFEEAREVFEGVTVLTAESELPLVAVGNVEFALMRYDHAVRNYRKALKRRGDSPFARAYLGEALFFKGDRDEGVRELEKASSLDPKGPAGDFARSLLTAIRDGFEAPPVKETTHQRIP